jgi:hypothetical protein
MKRRGFLLFFAALAAVSTAAAPGRKVLSGEISGNYPAAEYTVSGNAVVPLKKTLSLAAGSILRFENFSGITVRGTLVCKGTPSRPVLFTSINDDQNSGTGPEPFDWNGIKAAPEAQGVTMEHCVVTYSTFGVNIESEATPVTMINVSFHHNGSASVTREKKMMPVSENIPVSYTWPEAAPAARSATAAQAPATELKKAMPAEKKIPDAAVSMPVFDPEWKKTVRTAGAGLGLAGAALWLAGHLRAEYFDGLIKPGVPLSTAGKYENSRDNWVAVRNVGMGFFGAGAAAFAITFVF